MKHCAPRPPIQGGGNTVSGCTEEVIRQLSCFSSTLVNKYYHAPLLVAYANSCLPIQAELEKRLANAKKKASQMEKLLPRQITSKDQQEVLRLLCKAHELEVGNTELQASALYKENLLCQKDFVIQRLQQHRLLCEEIIQQQQTLIQGKTPALLSLCWHCWALVMPNGDSCAMSHILHRPALALLDGPGAH